jgi:hypothetical protein
MMAENIPADSLGNAREKYNSKRNINDVKIIVRSFCLLHLPPGILVFTALFIRLK